LQASWLSGRRARPVMNRMHGLWSLGSLCGAAAGALLTRAGVSLDVHLAVAAVVLFTAQAVGSQWMLRNDAVYRHQGSVVSGVVEPPSREHRRADKLGLLALGGLGLGGVAMEITPGDWAAFRFTDDLGASESFAALGFVAVATGMALGRFGGDWVAHRVAPGRLSRMAMGTVLAGVVVATLVPNQYVDLAGFFVSGLGASTLLPTLYDRAARVPGRPGAGLGALTAG